MTHLFLPANLDLDLDLDDNLPNSFAGYRGVCTSTVHDMADS